MWNALPGKADYTITWHAYITCQWLTAKRNCTNLDKRHPPQLYGKSAMKCTNQDKLKATNN